MSLKGKRILFVAPESFPVNGAEAIVNIKQLEILSKAGCIIDVVSKKRKWTDYPLMELSDTDIRLNSLNILEVDNRLNWSSIKLHILAFLSFGIVYKGAHWAWLALQVCKKLIKENQYDCVMTKSFPSELVGYWIKRHKHIKWIATWNDPYPVEKYPEPYGNGPNAKVFWGASKLIPMMEKYPDYHLFPSDRLKNYMLRYLNIPAKKIRIIPHVVLKRNNTSIPMNNQLSILYSGNLNYPRDPQPFLEAFSVFIKENPNANVKVYFQGVLPPNMLISVEKLGLKNHVEILPAVSYKESMLALSKYQVVLIIEAPCEEGIFLPTKVSDYMQEGKIIFAISPKVGVLHDLYNEGYIGYMADCQNSKSILNTLTLLFQDYYLGQMKSSKVPACYLPNNIKIKYSNII